MEKERIGSSIVVSKALQRLANYKSDNLSHQQTILGMAGRHNLCDAIPINFNLNQLTLQNLNPQILIYLALTENSSLVQFCQNLPQKHRRVYYYLQYFLPDYYPKKDAPILFESPKQKEFETTIKEEFIKEYEIGLYHCDYYLPKSNTIIEINGYEHYINFKERRIGTYQQKYNYLLKKGFKIQEVD